MEKNNWDDEGYWDWADQERLIRQDLEEMDARERERARRKRQGNTYREAEEHERINIAD